MSGPPLPEPPEGRLPESTLGLRLEESILVANRLRDRAHAMMEELEDLPVTEEMREGLARTVLAFEYATIAAVKRLNHLKEVLRDD